MCPRDCINWPRLLVPAGTSPGTLGLWALVVDAAPHDVKDMSEGLLATMIKDTEPEEAANDEDFLSWYGLSNDGIEVLRGRCTGRR